MQKTKKILDTFDKEELLHLAEELGYAYPVETATVTIIKQLLADFDAGNFPDTDTCSDPMLDLLVCADYGLDVDQGNGTVRFELHRGHTKVAAPDSTPHSIYQEEESGQIDITDMLLLAACFGAADDTDTSCRRCSLLVGCTTYRLNNRPACFGQLYQADHPDCVLCLEIAPCRVKTQRAQVGVN